MSIIYRNWTVHNLFAHPLSEIIWLISFGKLENFSNWIHDITIPSDAEVGSGRG